MKDFGFHDHDFHAIARRAYELALQGAYDQAATLLEGLRAIDPLDRYSLMTLADADRRRLLGASRPFSGIP